MSLTPAAGLLFDIDGTIADTDPLHLEAFNRTFAPFGFHFDRERFSQQLQGLANVDIARRFLPDMPQSDAMAILDQKEATFRSLAQTALHPVPGLFDLLDWADAHGLPMAAVTNAPRLNADLIIDGLGIRQRFSAIVIGAELPHGKPHPMPYLQGLRLLGASADHSLAFEDSRTGIASATAAGLTTIGIRTSLSDGHLIDAGVTLSADGYDDPALLKLVRARTGA